MLYLYQYCNLTKSTLHNYTYATSYIYITSTIITERSSGVYSAYMIQGRKMDLTKYHNTEKHINNKPIEKQMKCLLCYTKYYGSWTFKIKQSFSIYLRLAVKSKIRQFRTYYECANLHIFPYWLYTSAHSDWAYTLRNMIYGNRLKDSARLFFY